MRWLRSLPFLMATFAVLVSSASRADAAGKLQKVTFGLDWVAEAEYGGFYQAVADGIYRRYGLDVTIREGGPQVNNARLLLAGRLDFDITSNSFLAFNFVQQKIPFVAVAAFFQKDIDVLIAHRGAGEDSFAALKGKPIAISADTRAGWWLFLKKKYGYSDSQIRPYDFSLAPYFTSKDLVVQGFLTSEPFLVKEKTGHFPVVLRLDQAGFDGYGELIATSRKLAETDPSLVRRFVEASVAGWKSYLDGNPAPAFALIRKANPDMTMPILKFGYDQLKAHHVVEDAATAKIGIGGMTDARWKGFYRQMREAGLYPAHFDYRKAYTLEFIGRDGAAKH